MSLEQTVTHAEGVHVRGIRPDVWRAIRVEAVDRDMTAGELITEMWRLYLRTEPNRTETDP
jgi:hypothetical protein